MQDKSLDHIWQIPTPTGLRPAGGGNNLNQFVDTPSGTYMLRIYRNHSNTARILFELSVLTQLQQAGLPFAVPAPIPTRSGELLAEMSEGLATLTPAVPGKLPPRGNPQGVRAGGEALGALTRALATVRPEPLEGDNPAYGDLPGNHALVPDPLAAMAVLPVSTDKQARLGRIIQQLSAAMPALYRSLPRQVIHGDFTRGNVLMMDHRLTAVLDFEFTCHDVRAMDLATALEAWCALSWEGDPQWELLDAFGQGYANRQPLLPEEAEALPTLMCVRRAACLIHYLGRVRQRLEPEQTVAELADWTLQLDDWLAENAGELIRRARHWA